MNLWLRVLHLIIASFLRPRINPVADVSRLRFRVWPHDLDVSLHMNNGRYWALMDLGRADIMIRSGLWRPILKHGWVPVVSAGQIRFRREMRLFQSFVLETRILTWSESHVVMEQRLVSQAKDGRLILNAIALVRAGLYDRNVKGFMSVAHLLSEIGVKADPPDVAPEVQAFLDAEETLKKAA
ncbi:acyl-CoA thioesterase [Microvirga guangxiensis]|uniref:Thioesterase-like superfamily protein n=1 Tax=Microvirga guangxiensis TaxID=549386 RepID=A0A1G5KWL6_9HYPH|nr:thioesterase family protein [Microvirga guangxiensis]SCZ05005.1 Thioesterase-like superfamily protein [Microvirga guangxiensis]